jgi:hypothetical protein
MDSNNAMVTKEYSKTTDTTIFVVVETPFYLQSVFIYTFSKLASGLGVMAWGMALISYYGYVPVGAWGNSTYI